MRTLQVRFDDETYEALKREARERRVSMSRVLRELVRDHLPPSLPERPWRYEDLTLIASGRSGIGPSDPLYPLSENHDDAWADDINEDHLEKARDFARWRRERQI